jgi:hypothetical protein
MLIFWVVTPTLKMEAVCSTETLVIYLKFHMDLQPKKTNNDRNIVRVRNEGKTCTLKKDDPF